MRKIFWLAFIAAILIAGFTPRRTSAGQTTTNLRPLGTVTTAPGSKIEVVDALNNILPTLPSGPVTPSNADGIVVSYEGLTSGGITVAMTATTSTQVIAPTPGQNIYVTSCNFSNDHASTDTIMRLQDGSGGTTIWEVYVPHQGGNNFSFPGSPLKVPTQGNGLYVVNVTTSSSTYAFCNAFKSTLSY